MFSAPIPTLYLVPYIYSYVDITSGCYSQVSEWGGIYDVQRSAARSGYSLSLSWHVQCAYAFAIGCITFAISFMLLQRAYYAHFSRFAVSFARLGRCCGCKRWEPERDDQPLVGPPSGMDAGSTT